MNFPDRIPYNNWINSQLSIARHFGGITLNGDRYVLDYDNCPKKIIGKKVKYFPDLVKESALKQEKNGKKRT